ncbi:MAG: flagellar hook-associated protein FlgL [Candidatus Poribacteria bacterium]|nr:flagellar hook-associated protein FlgL [Candidatus Poribacteria bacterium]
MQMRVTLQNRAITLQKAIRDHSSDTAKSTEQIASGKRVQRPSDDPSAVRQSMLARAQLAQTEQFLSNIDIGLADLDMAESVLSQISGRLTRAQELASSASDGAVSTSARAAMALEVDAIIDEVVALSNSQFRGRYIFGGENTLQPPFVRNGDQVTYNGSDSGTLRRISADSPLVETTSSGAGIFFVNRNASNVVQDGVFAGLVALKQGMETNNQQTIVGTISTLRTELDRIVAGRIAVGARGERLELTKNRLQDQQLQLIDLKSTLEDADLSQSITNLQRQQLALQASMSVTASIVPTSLLDLLFS